MSPGPGTRAAAVAVATGLLALGAAGCHHRRADAVPPAAPSWTMQETLRVLEAGYADSTTAAVAAAAARDPAAAPAVETGVAGPEAEASSGR